MLTHSARYDASGDVAPSEDYTMSAPSKLRALLAKPGIHLMPCCFDALSARLVEKANFPVTFASGFSVAAAHGLPDTGLMSFGEMEQAMRRITGSLEQIPCIGDGDTGYGNAVNAKRTVRGYAAAGLAGVMIEDQVAPKRCGHTRDKAVVDRPTALARVRAAVDASREAAANEEDSILILARTDALKTDGLDEALERAIAFRDLGADIVFVEAPRSLDEMRLIAKEVSGVPQLVNCLAGGLTPVLPPDELEKLGFTRTLAAYPLDLLNASIVAQRQALEGLRTGKPPPELTLPFAELQEAVGFPEYYAEEAKYKS